MLVPDCTVLAEGQVQMLAMSLARLDSFNLAWALANFEYIYALEVLRVRQMKELLPTQCY